MRSIFYPSFVDSLLESSEQRYWDTQSRVEENAGFYYIQVDVPGLSKEDLKITLEDRHLKIEGERKNFGKLRKFFSLPDDIDLEKIQAQTKNGVLELALPKHAAVAPKSITVQDAEKSFFATENK